MYKNEDQFVCNENIKNYLSTIFDTKIYIKPRSDNRLPYLDLNEGHCTFVSIQYYSNEDKNKRCADKILTGCTIIIYKEDSVIYCYDPSSKKNTISINEIIKDCDTNAIEQYICFYTDSAGASLNQNKIVAPILY
jgi:hypothetical protein